MKKRMISIAALLLFAMGKIVSAGSLTLVESGDPKSVIIISSKAEKQSPEMQAAIVLADHIQMISGAKLHIKKENELGAFALRQGILSFPSGKLPPNITGFILVGKSTITTALGIEDTGLSPGGISLKRSGNTLTLLGSSAPSDKFSARHAVVEFLSSLGIRYLWPGKTGQVIPRNKTISIAQLDYTFSPIIGQRQIRRGGWINERSKEGLPRLQITEEEWRESRKKRFLPGIDDDNWIVWQRLGGHLGISGGHAGAGLSGGWKEHGEKHPEWFALQADGTRDQSNAKGRWRLCKSNPELIEYIATSIIERVKNNPSLTCISLSPNDGGYSSFCMCENCKKLDPPEGTKIRFRVYEEVGKSKRHEVEYVSLTDRMVWYWNQIVQRVTTEYPSLLFLGEAYSYWQNPPVREKLHPNLVIRYVPETTDGWEGWRNAGCQRIYWRPNILLAGGRDGKFNLLSNRLVKAMNYMADRGILATDINSIYDNWSITGFNYYAAARLNWNPRLSETEILQEYCSPGFGKAAKKIEDYILMIQEASEDQKNRFTPEFFASLRKRLNEAEEIASIDKEICDRIAFLRMGLNFTDLQCVIDRMAEQASKKDPSFDKKRADQLLELNYMVLRDLALNHYGVVNTPYLMWGSADYARWAPLRGRSYRPAEERIARAKTQSLTGKENSIEEMIVSLGLD
jgi:hypothetical protein